MKQNWQGKEMWRCRGDMGNQESQRLWPKWKCRYLRGDVCVYRFPRMNVVITYYKYILKIVSRISLILFLLASLHHCFPLLWSSILQSSILMILKFYLRNSYKMEANPLCQISTAQSHAQAPILPYKQHSQFL